MKDTIWLFPLLFIFHDLEEIIGFMPWIERNEKLLAKNRLHSKYPQRLIHRRLRASCGRGICRGAPRLVLCSYLPHSPTLSHLAGRICCFCFSSSSSYPASYLD